jgi:hypothetical protein
VAECGLRGGVIDADSCVLIMRSDAFIDYSPGATIITSAG